MDFEQYVAQHERMLFRFAVVLTGSVPDGEDLLSQVLSVAFARWARVSAARNVHAYVRQMLVNEYLSARRRAGRVALRDDIVDVVDRARAQPDHADCVAERDWLRAELARLPRRQRAAVVLRFYEGLDYEQIAEILGCTDVTVRSNLSRALARLRLELSDTSEPSKGRP